MVFVAKSDQDNSYLDNDVAGALNVELAADKVAVSPVHKKISETHCKEAVGGLVQGVKQVIEASQPGAKVAVLSENILKVIHCPVDST